MQLATAPRLMQRGLEVRVVVVLKQRVRVGPPVVAHVGEMQTRALGLQRGARLRPLTLALGAAAQAAFVSKGLETTQSDGSFSLYRLKG